MFRKQPKAFFPLILVKQSQNFGATQGRALTLVGVLISDQWGSKDLDCRTAIFRRQRLGIVPWQPRRPVKGCNELRRYVWDAQAQLFIVLQSLVGLRPYLTLYVFVESSVYRLEPLRPIFDAVKLGDFSQRQQVAETFGAVDTPFEEGGVAIEGNCSDASFYRVVVRTDARVVQEAVQFVSVVEPKDYSLANRASFSRQSPVSVFLNGVILRQSLHNPINAVRQRRAVLSAILTDPFELLLPTSALLSGLRLFPAV